MSAPPYLADLRARLAESPAASAAPAVLADDVTAARWERDAWDELAGAGPLERLLAQPGVSDVLVNAPDKVFVERNGDLLATDVRFADEAAVRRLAQRLAAGAGRRLDDAQPWVDAALPDGSRLHALLPPLVAHTTISLRVLARRRLDLASLVRAGSLSEQSADQLRGAVAARLALLVSGSTGSGKTTLLGALLDAVPAGERVLTVEDAAEIVTVHPHLVRLLCRPPNVEGRGAIGSADLVRQALRMRPDRIVVGEFRGGEVIDLMAALNTGHAGGMASVHANSPADVPARLTALAALAGVAPQTVSAQAVSAFDLVVHLARDRSGGRYVHSLGVPCGDATAWQVQTAWRADGGPAPAAGALRERLPS